MVNGDGAICLWPMALFGEIDIEACLGLTMPPLAVAAAVLGSTRSCPEPSTGVNLSSIFYYPTSIVAGI